MAGSMLFRRMLGNQLERARKRLGLTQREVAARLHRQYTMVSRAESGTSLIGGLELETLISFYELDDEQGGYLLRLRELAAQQPWWSHLGRRPEATEALLMLEAQAHRIRNFDMHAISGLLQTSAYARAINATVDIGQSEEQLDLDVSLRMQRQRRVWSSIRLDATFILDEGVLRRKPGSSATQRAQLAMLLDPPRGATVLVFPFNAGVSPATATFNIFDLELGTSRSEMPSKGVYVEGSAAQQGVIAEEVEEVARYELAFERTKAMALPREESRKKISEIMRSIRDD